MIEHQLACAHCFGSGCGRCAEELFVIACVDRTRTSDAVVWWMPNERGYTEDIHEAGQYSREVAERICRPHGQHILHLMFSRETVFPVRSVVDRANFGFMEKLRGKEKELSKHS